MAKSVNSAVQIFKALGDQTRLKIIKLMLSRGNNLCVGMLTQNLNVSQPAVSQHLKILKNAGLVESERMGFHIHYRLIDSIFEEYKINIVELLNTIDLKIDYKESCEFKGDKEKCNDINE